MIYPYLDIFKFICALMIVFIHAYCHDLGKFGEWINSVICNIGVPFFFITSGFFYAKGLQRNKNNENKYFFKYFKRVLFMYIVWSIITLPIAYIIIQRAHADYSLHLKFIYLIRLFLFTGSIGIYWYVLALIYNSAIIYFSHKKKAISLLFFTSILFWIIGVFYNSPYNNGNLLFKSIHFIFGSERTFLHVGLLYMCLGYLFAKYEHKIQIKTSLLIIGFIGSIILRTLEVKYLHTNTLQALEAILLFIIAIRERERERENLQNVSIKYRYLLDAFSIFAIIRFLSEKKHLY